MNAITFGTKRAYHGFLRFTRSPLASMGLTAARFDMMSALLTIRHQRTRQLWTSQRELRLKLGVSAPVVSRMLKALEALGWVKRERRTYGDGRLVHVRLSDAGEARIRQAIRVMVRAVSRLVLVAICFNERPTADQRLLDMATLESYLRALRGMFGDTASLYLPWGHPDD